MKRRTLLTLAGVAAAGMAHLSALPCAAETLQSILSDAYRNDATIVGGRFAQRQTDESLSSAQSAWRPRVTVTGGYSRANQYFTFTVPGINPVNNLTERTGSLNLQQPLYHGGAIDAGIERAESAVAAGAAGLASTEQNELLLAATAYLDMWRDDGVVALNAKLVETLTRRLHDVTATYKLGAATDTDLNQAKARLAGAVAGRLGSEAALASSRARLRALIGREPGPLDAPTAIGHIPATEDEARAEALAGNPQLAEAHHQSEAAAHQLDIARSALLPSVDAVGQLSHAENTFLRGVRQNIALIGVQATIPLYVGGAAYSDIRAAKEGQSAAESRITATERAVTSEIETAWNALQAARAKLDQFDAEITANDAAARDTEKELTVGSRTRLDELNAQEELFASQVNRVVANHDVLLATFQLEAIEGRFDPANLGLDVPQYDPTVHRDAVRDKWIGTDPVQ